MIDWREAITALSPREIPILVGRYLRDVWRFSWAKVTAAVGGVDD